MALKIRSLGNRQQEQKESQPQGQQREPELY